MSSDPQLASLFLSASRTFQGRLDAAAITISAGMPMEQLSGQDAMISVAPSQDLAITEFLILQSLHRLWILSSYGSLPFAVQETLVNRRIASFDQESSMYYFMHLLLSSRVRDLRSYVMFNMPWIVMKPVDTYKSRYLKKLAFKYCRQFRGYRDSCKRLFALLQRDLRLEKNRLSAARELELLGLCR